MATNSTSTSEMRKIVDDLTSKYPRGPRGLLNRSLYTVSSEYSRHYEKFKSVVKLKQHAAGYLGLTELTVQHWGYEPMQLFRLGVRTEEGAQTLIKSLYPDIRGAAVTRRSRLLWSRLALAVTYVMKEGTEGIWSVVCYQSDYGSLWRDMRVWGASRAEVEAQIRLIGPLTGLKPEWTVQISFHDLGSPDQATQYALARASARAKRIKVDIESHHRALAKLEKELEEEMSKNAQAMGGIMLLSGSEEGSGEEVAQ